MPKKLSKFTLFLFLLLGLYFLLRLINLTILPIFADEAIYIRWSQLIISDWQRYLFFPLNDGKTPLQMWLMIPFLKIFTDQLFAARLLSVFFGAGQLIVMIKLMSLFNHKKNAQLFTVLMTIFIPGFILINRLALIDTQLTFFLSLSFYFAYKSLEIFQRKISTFKTLKLSNLLAKIFSPALFFSALFFGLALLTKFSAILFLPVLVTLLFYFWPATISSKREKIAHLFSYLTILIAIGFLAGCLLLTLKISPVFPQLFARGGDFLYSLNDFFAQPTTIILRNLQLFSETLSNYLTSIVFIFSFVFAIYLWPQDKKPALLLLSGLAFLSPILLLGKVIYGRYLLPALPFFILSFNLSFAYLHTILSKILKTILLSAFFLVSGYFTYAALFSPAKMLLTPDDSLQYLNEWSSGYGITETISLINQLKAQAPTLVLTEGSFGTLPDALLVYYFNQDVSNLKIEGIGQPVYGWEKWQSLIDQYPQAILVVNSHRMKAQLPSEKLLGNFSRPASVAPSLQVWNLK